MDGFPSFATARDIVLFALAIWGAGLSTYTFANSLRRERRRVAVSLANVFPVYGSTLGPDFIKLEAVNIGHRSVTVTTLTIAVEGKWIFPAARDRFPGLSDTPLPAVLNDGQSAHLYMPSSELARALLDRGHKGTVTLVPMCVDSTGAEHKGKAWKNFNLIEAAQR